MARVFTLVALHTILLASRLPAALAADRVRVDFYAEGLCPYCIEFTRTKLADLFKTGLAAITELDFIPSGNARLRDDGSIACQHGPNECALNKAIACALAFAPSQDDWFPFVECIEAKAKDDAGLDVAKAADACAVHAGLLPSRVLGCYEGPLGDTLQRRALERTESLVPPHKWVPWVVVNGIPLFDDFDNVATFICAAYNGYPKPKYCLHPPPPDPSSQLSARASLNVGGDAALPAAPDVAQAAPGRHGTGRLAGRVVAEQ